MTVFESVVSMVVQKVVCWVDEKVVLTELELADCSAV
jgi:hypothetical protein